VLAVPEAADTTVTTPVATASIPVTVNVMSFAGDEPNKFVPKTLNS